MENEAPVTMIRERDREERQRNRLIGYLRIVFVILLSVIVALGIVSESTETTSGVQLSNYWWLLAGGTAIFFFVVTGLDILTNRKKLSAVSAILFGAFAGLILTILLGIGGGFILVPAMIYLLGMATSVVVGTSLFQTLFVTAAATMVHATTTKAVDIVLAGLLLLGVIASRVSSTAVATPIARRGSSISRSTTVMAC